MRIDFVDFKRAMAEFGITDLNFLAGLYAQLMNADGFGCEGLEFAISVIKGIKPNDQLLAMLGAQAALLHMATMKNGRQLGRAEVGSPLQESAARTATQLSRAFTALMLASKRYRTGGEQKVTVQHVSVTDRGQAFVGSVTQNALEKPASETMTIAAPAQVPIMARKDAESMEEEAQSWHDWSAEREKAALVDTRQPEAPLPDKSQSKPTPVWRPGKPRRRRSSSETTTALRPRPRLGPWD